MRKFCQVYTQPMRVSGDFVDCATEGQSCNPVGGTMSIYRYGTGNRWIYRMGSVSEFNCGAPAFDSDPAKNQTKFCQVASLPAKFAALIGSWEKVASCTGACSALSHALAVGITGSRSETVTKTFTHELSVAVETKLTFHPTVEGKITVGYKYAHAESKSIQETLTHQKTVTKLAQCAAGGTRTVMYQWRIDVDEYCGVEGGHCLSSIHPYEFVCAVDPPQGYIPACVPEACADKTCSVCKE